MLSFLGRMLCAVGCASLLSVPSFAASQGTVLSYVSDKALCAQFNNVEIKGDRLFSYGRDIPGEVVAVFERALTRLGCVVYRGKGKRNGIITAGISLKRVMRDDLLGPGPREGNSIFRVSLSWSKGVDNAETLPLTFIFTRGDLANSDLTATEDVAIQSLRELERAIRSVQGKGRKVSRQ